MMRSSPAYSRKTNKCRMMDVILYSEVKHRSAALASSDAIVDDGHGATPQSYRSCAVAPHHRITHRSPDHGGV
jgi:hypothetical protein